MPDINRTKGLESQKKSKGHIVMQKVRNSIAGAFGGNIVKEEGSIRYVGKFDKNGNFTEGTIHFSDGFTENGKYETINGHCILREGEKEYSNGKRETGKFDKYGRLIEGERYLPNGVTYRGRFDVNTSEVYDGEVIYTDGKTVKINKK